MTFGAQSRVLAPAGRRRNRLPDLYAVSPRVKGGPGITPLGEWRFESLWIDRP